MFKIVRFLLFLCLLGFMAYFITSIPVGRYTLWRHFQAIWATPEARQMREDVGVGLKKAQGRIVQGNSKDEAQSSPVPPDRLTDRDRHDLKQLLDKHAGGSGEPK